MIVSLKEVITKICPLAIVPPIGASSAEMSGSSSMVASTGKGCDTGSGSGSGSGSYGAGSAGAA